MVRWQHKFGANFKKSKCNLSFTMTRYFLKRMTGKAAGQTKFFSERRLELNSVLFRNENGESFVLERGVREEKDDRLEALLQAEVAMVPRLAAASGELADGGLQARVCGLGIGEGRRLVGPLPGLFKLEGAAGGASLSAHGRVPKGEGDAASNIRRRGCSAPFASRKIPLE